MTLEIEQEFEVPEPPERVWAFLTSPEKVAGCLPGGRLLERVDERTFRGEMELGIGPLAATFRGRMRFDRLDEEALEVDMSGEGGGRDGAPRATMRMTSKLVRLPGGGTRVAVRQSVSLPGGPASLGGEGLARAVADLLFGRFTACVERELAAAGSP